MNRASPRPLSLSLSLLAAAIALTGCISVKLPAATPVELYALDVRVDGAPAPGGPLVLVPVPRAAPGMDGPRMAYVRRPHELRYFARSQWVDAPARMVAPLLVRALAAQGLDAVAEAGAGPAAAFRLESEVVRLEQAFDATPSRVRFALRVRLVDVAAGRVLGARELEAVEPAPSDDPYGGATAANAAVGRVVGEAAEWCARLVRAPPR